MGTKTNLTYFKYDENEKIYSHINKDIEFFNGLLYLYFHSFNPKERNKVESNLKNINSKLIMLVKIKNKGHIQKRINEIKSLLKQSRDSVVEIKVYEVLSQVQNLDKLNDLQKQEVLDTRYSEVSCGM